jgi:osmotically-inducible protein OsmY
MSRLRAARRNISAADAGSGAALGLPLSPGALRALLVRRQVRAVQDHDSNDADESFHKRPPVCHLAALQEPLRRSGCRVRVVIERLAQLRWFATEDAQEATDLPAARSGVQIALGVRSRLGYLEGTMTARSISITALVVILGSPVVFGAAGRPHAQGSATPPPAADNTRQNQQGGQTADQQSQTKEDLALVQKIRQEIMKDKSLSTNAHNCKVITNKGAVLLRGPVNSDKEKATVGGIAVRIAGAKDKVTNELVVKSGTQVDHSSR